MFAFPLFHFGLHVQLLVVVPDPEDQQPGPDEDDCHYNVLEKLGKDFPSFLNLGQALSVEELLVRRAPLYTEVLVAPVALGEPHAASGAVACVVVAALLALLAVVEFFAFEAALHALLARFLALRAHLEVFLPALGAVGRPRAL